MAAAVSMVDGAVKQKGTRERVRAIRGGAFGHTSYESRDAQKARDREAGKLSEEEQAELRYLWGGFDAALGVRSIQGALEDHLMRAPPRVGEELERAVEEILKPRGKQGAPRESVVEILAHEYSRATPGGVGATRHEARMALRRMVGAGRIAYFVSLLERKNKAGGPEIVPTEMARLVAAKSRRIPGKVPAEVRWARADEALQAYCATIACSESTRAPGPRLPPSAHTGRADAARRALGALSGEHRRVIERAYGSTHAPAWAGLSPEEARLASLCPSVERARQEMVGRLVKSRNPGSDVARRGIDRSVLASDALRARLDQQPEDELGKARWRVERDALIVRVKREAAKLLEDASEAFRSARG